MKVNFNTYCKRAIDLLVASVGLVLLSPLLLVASMMILLDSQGGVLFRQQRFGRGCQPFELLKLRSMAKDTAQTGPQITVDQDQRITRVGRILRKTKVDELPQLLNVIRGDMSLVGPRPEVPKYVEMFREEYGEILEMRPGITDLASLRYFDESSQLAASNDPEKEYINRILPEKIALAKEYVRNNSILADCVLIARTLLLVVGAGRGRSRCQPTNKKSVMR